MTSARESDRLRTLLETGIAISSELSLDAVLERIVHAAAALTGARYVALGVIDRSGTALERFITTGIDEQTRAATGEDFSEEDEELVTLLAAQAAVAVENARLYESATQWSRQLESLNEIGNALVGELDLARLLHLVSTRLRELIGARLVAIALPTGSDLRIEAADGEGSAGLGGGLFCRALYRRPVACSSAGAANASTRSSKTLKSTRRQRASSRLPAGSLFRCWLARMRLASSSRMTSSAQIRVLAMRICGWRSSSPRGPRSPSTSRAVSNAMRSGELWPARNSSGSASRASCTTRPAKR